MQPEPYGRVEPGLTGPVVAEAEIRGGVQEKRYPIGFTATGGEYFRIWIVNLALTLITLGIYSAWAKVRKQRYFYSHTRVDGEGFEYRANPIAILKGRLIAVAILAVFYGVGFVAPLWQLVLFIPLLIAAPWLIVRSLAFNAYNTAYRNVRFAFTGTYKTCLKLLLGYSLLTVVTLGFGYPFLSRRLTQFMMEGHAYGTTRFVLAEGFKKPFVRPYFIVFGVSILLFIGLIGFIAVISVMGAAEGGEGMPQWVASAMFAGFVVFYALLFMQIAYIKARTTNVVWNHLHIGPARFESALRARDLLWLFISNFIVVVLTVGLAAPWAVVRMARYRAAKTALIAAGSLDSFAQGEAQSLGATAAEVGEMLDFDIAL
jgi:uncharacterized membrane protein YjgN (DUF898 family)